MKHTAAIGLRRQVELVRGGGARARLPVELKQAVLAHVRARRERGVTWSAIEDEVGVSAKRLHTWLRVVSRAKSPAAVVVQPRMVPVRVVSRPVSALRGEIIVRGPRGVTVEGMSVADVAELLAELSL
jgi:hypothetical protein